MKKYGKFFFVALIMAMSVTLFGCGSDDDSDNDSSNDKKAVNSVTQECYEQCEEWGGEVDMCKENCDASTDENSVFNQDNDDAVAANDGTFSSWDKMPSEVPEFTYGDFKSGIEGMGSWIVDFENVSEDALDKYTEDLDNAGWGASKIEVSGMISGSTDEYKITVNIDRYENKVQITVRKAN